MALKSVPIGPLSPGAKKLRAWLESNSITVPAFADNNQIDRFEVQRVIRGETKRIDVDFAAQIQVATRGAVPWWIWISTDVHAAVRNAVRKTADAEAA